jgi:hypothetical protein
MKRFLVEELDGTVGGRADHTLAVIDRDHDAVFFSTLTP